MFKLIFAWLTSKTLTYIKYDGQPSLHRLPSHQRVLSHGLQSSAGKIQMEKRQDPNQLKIYRKYSLMPFLINSQPETFLNFKIHLKHKWIMLKLKKTTQTKRAGIKGKV